MAQKTYLSDGSERDSVRLPETNSKFAPENQWLEDASSELGVAFIFNCFQVPC